MRKSQFPFLLAVFAGVGSCNDSPTDPSVIKVTGRTAFDIGVAQVLTGGRASGHAEIGFSDAFGAVNEKFSFTAQSAGTLPNAKGQLVGEVTFFDATTGETRAIEIQMDVNCLVVDGNQAAISGPARKFVVNGEPSPTPPDVLIQVRDNGEGRGSLPDEVGIFTAWLGFPQICSLSPFFGTFPSEKGNIQVRSQ